MDITTLRIHIILYTGCLQVLEIVELLELYLFFIYIGTKIERYPVICGLRFKLDTLHFVDPLLPYSVEVLQRAFHRSLSLATALIPFHASFLYFSMVLIPSSHVQSHLYIRRSNRRLSLVALPGLPTASRGVKLPLPTDTRSVFQSLQYR